MPGQYLITPPQLNDFLHIQTAKVTKLHPEIRFALSLLLFTGCRSMEAIDLNRWSVRNNNVMLLATLKKNLPRAFTLDELPPDFMQWYLKKDAYNSAINYRKTQYVFQQLVKPYGIVNNNKSALLHLYRYNYIKWLNYNGMEPEQIQVMIGHNNLESTMFYVDAALISSVFLNTA